MTEFQCGFDNLYPFGRIGWSNKLITILQLILTFLLLASFPLYNKNQPSSFTFLEAYRYFDYIFYSCLKLQCISVNYLFQAESQHLWPLFSTCQSCWCARRDGLWQWCEKLQGRRWTGDLDLCSAGRCPPQHSQWSGLPAHGEPGLQVFLDAAGTGGKNILALQNVTMPQRMWVC